MTIAYVTYQDKGAHTSITVEEEDAQLLNFLILKGLEVETVIWSDPVAVQKTPLRLQKQMWKN